MAAARGIRAGRAYVELGVSDKLVAGLKRATRRLKAFGVGVQQIGARLAKMAGLMALPLAAGVKVFADFEQQMANVSTMLDEPDKHMANFRKGIRRMAVEFGESTEALAGGLYDILSASIAPSKALDVLTAAARAAKGGMTDTKTAADAITTILNSYGLSAAHAGEVSDLLFQVVKRGKTTFAELAPAIGMVASTAASANVGLDELGAMIATLTRKGLRTENAITAVSRVIATFLKPTDEAAAYARKLGFTLSTTTLRAEGLAGVFKRISKLPPEAIARLFPNIRALRGVIPALRNIEEFVGDIDIMAARAGATETAYQKMTKTLAHAFAKLKQSALVAFSYIGEALAEPVARAAARLKDWGAAVGDFVKRNRALVVGVAKFVSIALAAGLGLMVAGWAIGKLAGLLGLVTLAFKAAILVIGALGSVLAFLLSPIGLVTAAIAGLGAYLLYTTGVGGKALGWLGERFATLKDEALTAYDGITAALASGDMGLAARILWLTLKIWWRRGVKGLLAVWLNFKHAFLKIAYGAWYGLQAGLEMAWHGMEVAWIETTAFLSKTWTRFTAWVAKAWQWTGNKLTKAWNHIKGLFDESFDVATANAAADQAYEAGRERIDQERDAKLRAREDKRSEARNRARQVHEGTLAEIGSRYEAKTKAMEDEYDQKMKESEDKLKQARKDWQDAIEQARKKRAGKGAEGGPGKLKGPDELLDKVRAAISDLPDALATAGGGASVRGTFYAAAAQSLLAGGGAAERTAKASERTAKNTDKLVRHAQRGGLTFK